MASEKTLAIIKPDSLEKEHELHEHRETQAVAPGMAG